MRDIGNYLEVSLAFLESREMREYLRNELPKWGDVSYYCAKIVAYAPAPIEKKLPVLEQIGRMAKPEPGDKRTWENTGARFADSCRSALAERYCGPDGGLFWLQDFRYHKNGRMFGHAFFTEFDSALRYLEELTEEYPQESSLEEQNYTITKCLPKGRGRLEEYCTWYLNAEGELWYFDYCYDDSFWRRRDWKPLIDACGCFLNLPVPFQPGEIVEADCLPFAKPRRVLILEVGDNQDCCCLQALFMQKKGRLNAGAFKHNDFLQYPENSPVSGLYRAKRWTGKLSHGEEPLAVLSSLIQERPAFGREIWDCLYEWKWGKTGYPQDGITWEELKGELGL